MNLINSVPFGPVGGNQTALRAQRFRTAMDSRGVQYGEDFFTYSVNAAALAAGTTAILPINIQKDSAFEWLACAASVAAPTAGFTGPAFPISVLLTDTGSQRNLMNQPVPLLNIAGTGLNPFILPVPRRFMPMTQFTAVLNNFGATDTQNVKLSFIGRKLMNATMPGSPLAGPNLPRFNAWRDSNGQLFSEDLYCYDFSLADLANAATTPVTVLIEGDSDFEWIESTFSCDNPNETDTCVDPSGSSIDVAILDGGTQRNLLTTYSGNQNAPSQVSLIQNVAGSGAFPFILKQTRIFASKTPVQVTFTNVHPTAAYENLHFSMIGRKIFALDTVG
jgi:hypothetical protein